jgi:hypothetical protein
MWRRLRDRPGGFRLQAAWYCGPQCLEQALRQCLARARTAPIPVPPPRHRIPLGLLLLSRGQLTNSQLRSALDAHRSSGEGRLGEWLEKLGFASEQQITTALGLQWACPILPSFAADAHCASMLPLSLLESFHMLPVHYVAATRTLYVAFSEGVDYTALYAVEQMLDCRTEASLLTPSALTRVLRRLNQERRPQDLRFEGRRDHAEIARIACGYALKLAAWQVRAVTCGEFVWVRLECHAGATNLLFCRPAADGATAALLSDDGRMAG